MMVISTHDFVLVYVASQAGFDLNTASYVRMQTTNTGYDSTNFAPPLQTLFVAIR
jgi:hypothetical protein